MTMEDKFKPLIHNHQIQPLSQLPIGKTKISIDKNIDELWFSISYQFHLGLEAAEGGNPPLVTVFPSGFTSCKNG